LLAWSLVRYEFPGKKIVDALVDLPFALPTAVAGISLTALYAPNGWLGAPLAEHGIRVAFTPTGILVALIFIGLPFVVGQFGGNPAIVCAIGMLAGFCGTLMTPMAANFNVVPANLLELPDRNAALNGVIRAQLPTALIMLGVNMALMYFLAFRF
jgi:hypothetical protein